MSASDLSVVNDWVSSGQAKFTLDLTNANRSQLTVTVKFNNNISGGWGGSASAKASGNELTLSWYLAPETAEITVQANCVITQLKITGCSASNA